MVKNDDDGDNDGGDLHNNHDDEVFDGDDDGDDDGVDGYDCCVEHLWCQK